jgi:RNA recognition motif-containing protein
MKLQELLQEDLQSQEIQKWLGDWSISSFRILDEVSLNKSNINEIFNDKTLKVVDGLESIDLYTNTINSTFSWPFAKYFPSNMELSIQGSSNKPGIIENFKDFPDVHNLFILRYIDIKSLDGFENTKITFLNLEHLKTDIECGLLRLLKSKHLQIVKPPKFGGEDLKHALTIVDKHLSGGDGNIPDCMDELIEAGLKKYAKL